MSGKEKKLTWIKKVTPVLYDIAMAGLCLYAGFRCRKFLNLLTGSESGFIVFGILLIYYVFNFMAVKRVPAVSKRKIVYAVSIGTFILIYLTMFLAVSDIFQLILGIFVKDGQVLETVFTVCGFVCLAALVIAVCAGMRHAEKIVSTGYVSSSDKIGKDTRIVLITDLHIGYFVGRKHIGRAVRRINSMKPDIIIISGDILNGGGTSECPELPSVAGELSNLRSVYGTFAVTGNHDPGPADAGFREFLEKAHIRLLEDEVLDVGELRLIGRNTKIRPRKTLGELMEKGGRDKLSVVIDHDPVGISEAREEGADYILCGHTHRGQVFPLNLLVRFVYSKDEFFGMSVSGPTTSVVSSGCGFFSMPMRVGSDSEVVCLDIRSRS